MSWHKRFFITLLALLMLLGVAWVHAAIGVTDKISDVRGTKHNLSSVADGTATPSGGTVPVRTVKASPTGTGETQVCVFCHTPHGATSIVAPLWNRTLSNATYPNVANPTYSSSSIEASTAEIAAGPGGSSKLCLSCHDGTMAIDKVNVLNAAANPTVTMTGLVGAAGSGKMPIGSGTTTGFTRNLGTNLTNDHPISFTYNSTLATADGELRTPDGTATGAPVGNRVAGAAKPKMPLENNQMQCATCHDPHLRDKIAGNGNAKFLRMNRFQVSQPTGGNFSESSDIICLACHNKGGTSWAYSAHANASVATQNYKGTAAQQREFPFDLVTAANNPPVWQVSCLNCHDTHTVAGARRLLREGTNDTNSPKQGGNPALEETCYQCHTTVAGSAVTYPLNAVTAIPDIKADFTTTGNKRMPITSAAQLAGSEVHDIGGVAGDGKDLVEPRVNLGSTNLNNRHAECTDCHNPHRVIKYKLGLAGPLTSLTFSNSTTTGLNASGTHQHTDDGAAVHTNIISGVLRGSWGVEPSYNSNSFHITPSTGITFAVKRGDPGIAATPVTTRPGAETYVTREYQICLKCHSNYAYPDDNIYPNSANRPQLGGSGLTAANANGHTNFTSYTNQAKEFQAPLTHAVAVGSVSKGNEGGTGTAASNANNHRSWHPVMAPTGRLARTGAWIAPWNESGTGNKANRLGVQTMYCSDCHGSATAVNTAIPNNGENGSPWGPHGSSINFLLKGDYSTATGVEQTSGLCFKCHSYGAYATGGGGTGWKILKNDGSSLVSGDDGHQYHRNKIRPPGSSTNGLRCNWCHVAVPHGWKNRNFLVNLLDVGAEAGSPVPAAVAYTQNVGYTNGPYYRNSFLRVVSFPAAGVKWKAVNCNGGKTDNSGMTATCDNPN